MTLELDIDDVYLKMLEQIEEERDGEPKDDIARAVENIIHENYQMHTDSS